MDKLQTELDTIKKQIAELTEAIKSNQEKQAKTENEQELAELKAENEELLKKMEILQDKLKEKEETEEKKGFVEFLKDFFLGEAE